MSARRFAAKARRSFVIVLIGAVAAGCFSAQHESIDDPAVSAPTAYLRSDPYPNLSVEVVFAPGTPPSKLALDQLVPSLEEATGKHPRFMEPRALDGWAAQPRNWSVTDLDRVITEESPFGEDRFGEAGEAVLQVFYLDGHGFDASGEVAGLAVKGRAFVFVRSFAEEGKLMIPPREDFERSVMMHEVGHVLGLVNCGIPMLTPREDPGGSCHSMHSNSVMYVRSSPHAPDLPPSLDVPPYRFDEYDLADLRAFREAD